MLAAISCWRRGRSGVCPLPSHLLSFECGAEGTKLVELDRTEIFTRLHFRPVIRIARGSESKEAVQTRTLRALEAAQKYSLVANSVKSEIVMEPDISVGLSRAGFDLTVVREGDLSMSAVSKHLLGRLCIRCVRPSNLEIKITSTYQDGSMSIEPS